MAKIKLHFNIKFPNMRYFISLIIIFSSFSTFAAPPNDDPCNAIVLTSSLNCNYVQYTNAAATATAGVTAPGCANYAGGDVWFQVVVPAGGSIRINSNTGVMTDGGMAVYSGTCGSLTLISCDDDSSPNGLMPYLTLTGLTPGSTVWIRFWEYGNDNRRPHKTLWHEEKCLGKAWYLQATFP
jgi:hypothetical protein